jgi:hypothetical protein
LIDVMQPPTVLVEARKLALPHTGPGNRFVSGWHFHDDAAGLTIEPGRSRFLRSATRRGLR